MGDIDDGWEVFGSRPGSSASTAWPAYSDRDGEYSAAVDEHAGFSKAATRSQSLNRTYSKPNTYNPRGKKPSSPSPVRNGFASNRSGATTPNTSSRYNRQNYFLNKNNGTKPAVMNVDDALFNTHTQNGNDKQWEAPWNEGRKTPKPQTPTRGRSPTPTRNQSPTPTKPRNYYGKLWNKRNESYADEQLFGHGPEEPEFKSPWDQNKKQTYVFDATDYKALEIKKQLQNSAKNSRKTSTKGPMKPDSERVHHIEKALQSQLAVQGERPQSRAGSSQGNRPSTPKKNTPKFKDSYVDELLFGPKPQEADFPAPWEDNKKKRIHVFDGTNTTVTIHHENGTVEGGSRPGSRAGSIAGSRAGSRRGSTGSAQVLRPAWK